MKTLTTTEAELLAGKFRSMAGLNLSEPLNVKTLLRKLNIITLYRPLSEASCGISCRSASGKKFMLINSRTTRGRQHFTIAHELYHLFYDEHPMPHVCKGMATGEEKNANRFASALLMPKEGLLSVIPNETLVNHSMNLPTLLRLEQLFSVSRSTLLVRLKDLEIITQKQFDELDTVSVKDSARDYGYDLSLYEAGNEGLVIGDFGEKARILYERGKISEGHYQELRKMIDYVGTHEKSGS
jgi:Zn-dependent peptidase ImmA (M78 family)